MKQIRIRAALQTGWTQFMRRPWYLFGITLAFAGLLIMTAGDSAIVTALTGVLYAGYLYVLLRHYRGETVVFDDFFDIVDKRWIYFAFLIAIKGILLILGFLCFIVPGVYLTIRWMFAELAVIDEGLRPLEALKRSSELTAGVRGKLFLYAVVVTLLSIVGLMALVLGVFVVALVVQLATIKLYFDLKNTVTETAPVTAVE